MCIVETENKHVRVALIMHYVTSFVMLCICESLKMLTICYHVIHKKLLYDADICILFRMCKIRCRSQRETAEQICYVLHITN